MKFAADFGSFLVANMNLIWTRLDVLQQKVDVIESFVESDAICSGIYLDMAPAGSKASWATLQ